MRFSIITPSFRGGDWLRLCVASVADQGVELEHIIQDGGSDDGSVTALEGVPGVKVQVEKDAGMYDAINRGLRRASGDLLGYLNCDEQYLAGALKGVERYFTDHSKVEVAFGDVVIVDAQGDYLWHRKMLSPTLRHTWTCPLSTLTCGTFFRRSVLERASGWFDPNWKIVGDSVWMLGLLKDQVRMGTIGTFTSAFTHTGSNLSLNDRAVEESRRFHQSAPPVLRWMRPLILLRHRSRKWANGIYHQAPFDFSLYTLKSPSRRITHHAAKPTSRWRW